MAYWGIKDTVFMCWTTVDIRLTWDTASSDGNQQVAINFSTSFVFGQRPQSLNCLTSLTNWMQN